MTRTRISVVVSHPIQHFVPQYHSWSELPGVALHVIFETRKGLEPYHDADFDKEVSWGSMNLQGLDHRFLSEAATRPLRGGGVSHVGRALDQSMPDVLVVYGHGQRLQRRAALWARRRQIPVIYISDSELRRPRSAWKQAIRQPLLRAYLSQVSCFLTAGDANEGLYTHYGVPPRKFVRSGFPIDLDHFQTAWDRRYELRAAKRRELGISDQTFTLLSVGKLVEGKSHEHLIRACGERLRDLNYELVVVGSGPDEGRLKEIVARFGANVTFVGFVEPHDLPAYYAAADLYVQPSAVDAHPLSVTEAGYMGVPSIVSSRVGSWGPSDDVQPGVTGGVFEWGDEAELAVCIQQLAADSPKLARYGRAARENQVATQAKAHGGALLAAVQMVTSGKASR